MERTKEPFVVENPVLTTIAKAAVCPGAILALIIFVPLYKKDLETKLDIWVLWKSSHNWYIVSSVAGNFETGTDSPVSMDSLTIQSLDRRIESQGNIVIFGSDTSYITFKELSALQHFSTFRLISL